MGLPREPATRGLMVEGFLVFVQYLFDHFDLLKVYLEVPEFNRSLVAGTEGTLLLREGELRDHHYFGDRRWALFVYALYRRKWEEFAPHYRGDWPEEQ